MPSTQLETRNPKLETDLRELAQDIVRRAMAGGATAAECVVREGDEFSTLVRLGQVETLKESGSRSIGVRVFNGQRAASTYSSDFSRAGLDRMVKSALELSKITSEDPFGGIPEASQLGSLTGDLDLYHEDVYSLPGPDRIDYARRAEKAALDFDPRIKNSEGGSFDAATGHKVLANSHGFVGEYRRSYCSVAAVPIAQTEDGAMQRDYWYSVARTLSKLESPEQVGKVAAERTLRRLGARKAKTAQVPIIFDPMVATSILEHIFEGVNGDSVYRGASFLAGKLGQKIAGDNVTVIDDGTIPGGFGTSPFDGEGVPTRRTVVIENGVLKFLSSEYLHREEAGTQDHRQRLPRTRRHAGHRPRQLLPAARNQNAEAIDFRNQRRSLRHRISRPWREPGDWRLFPRRLRPVDLRRRVRLSSRRNHRRRQPERNVLQHLRDRERSRIPRLGGLADAAHRRPDRRRRIIGLCSEHEIRQDRISGSPASGAF